MTNVDSAEINKFSELAHRWWDPNSEFKPLHEINPLRLNWIDQLCGGLSGKTVVDVGCGGGILSESMAAKGATVTGVDMSEKALKVARLHLYESELKVDYKQMPAEELATQQPETFDVVTCMEMLEHVPDPSSVVAACARLAKPGGWVFFSTINRNPKSYLLAVVGAEYILKLLPRGTHDYAKFIKPAELAHMVRDAGLELQAITGMTYKPITRVYRLEADTDVNYLIACQKPV
jgi:2-polyprenyl-6-hydroxyphenyl methylase/3-demethylubiquinone-9 3-methyltransferase